MTASTFADATLPETVAETPPLRRPNLFGAWRSSFLVYFFPSQTGRLWLDISPLRAVVVALVNLALAPLWLVLLAMSVRAWDEQLLRVRGFGGGGYFRGDYVSHPVKIFFKIELLPPDVLGQLKNLPFLADIVIAITITLFIVTALAILFFVLLPFAARPGSNRACVTHVVRVVLLSTGWVHIWGPILSAGYIYFIAYRYAPGLENIIGPLTAELLLLSVWSIISLIIAARCDYRKAADLPKRHDPWCEACGYNLTGIDISNRCPECGKSIVESLSPEARPPTPWEVRPSLANVRSMRNQVLQLVRQPRRLFFSMPTLTGQRAAQRWLISSVLFVAALATLILPAYNILCLNQGNRMAWSWDLLVGSLFVGFVWAILALMMVGIETAGIATFSRMKAKKDPDFGAPGGRQGVHLATSAKVTAYSSILMVPWVFLGGAQLLASEYWNICNMSFHWHISMRMEQVFLAGSLSIAHIGGLLWYELTVYRGIRGIQYANK